MKHRYWLTGFLLTLSVWAAAHEFWLQPTRFFAQPGDVVQVRTLVGEHFLGEPSEGKKNRIVQYKHYSALGETDLSPALSGDNYGDVAVKLTRPGTHMLVFANTPKFIELAPDKFLDYLREDGLDNVIALRKQRGDTAKPGRELYQRCAKTLIQVGDTPGKTVQQTANLPLDIVPVQNPYALKAGQRLGLQIRFLGKPLAAARVRYWVKNEAGNVQEEESRTDANGQVQFTLKSGQNMVSTVRMIPAEAGLSTGQPAGQLAEWHSYWGSLTFGCR